MRTALPVRSEDPLAALPAALHDGEQYLLLENGQEGWSGLYCHQGREDAEETLAYLNARYPDGLARLRPLGDLLALGGTPGYCEAMNTHGDYLPSRDPDYPPAPEPELHDACAVWNAIKSVTRTCLHEPDAGWRLADAWGRPRPESPEA